MELVFPCILTVLAIVSLLYLQLRKRFTYWAQRGVLHDKPELLHGNVREIERGGRQALRVFYKKYKDQAKFAGFYLRLRPTAVLLDLDLIKSVLIKDFNNFTDRGYYHNERDDPISAHLVNLDGPKWRNVRTKLTPTFSTVKLKFMLPTVLAVAEQMIQGLKDLQDKKGAVINIEVSELLADFTTDAIGSCTFGLNCNSLKQRQNQFRLMGRKGFFERRHNSLVWALMSAYPNAARWLGMKVVPEDVYQFFMQVVRATLQQRKQEPMLKRHDFIDMLLELKWDGGEALSEHEIAAQAYMLFLGGQESSSKTLTFCLFELARNLDIQERARKEIKATLERHKNELNLECLRELKYLLQIMHETLRLYPIFPILIRKAVNDYVVPHTEHVLEKNTMIIIPVDAIQNDPDIYANPEEFEPERFVADAELKRNSATWLPFGVGPRHCIGMRFGEMQTMVGLAMLLINFRFTTTSETQIPLKLGLNNFILDLKCGIVLGVEKI